MRNVYSFDENSKLRVMPRLRAKNEQRELQQLLETYLDLLPGDQIDPDDPRRWLLIKKEVPVPDPSSGSNRWSIDLLLADQSATPTFIECKRFEDTRARREVVGQILEYAANAPHYWTTDLIRSYAEETARAAGTTIDQALGALAPDENLAPEQFFEQFQANLREGQVRLVFFLEEAPPELKSIVEFLNNQTERTEVLVVEARAFSDGDHTVLVPTLHGYTERAQRLKRVVTVHPSARRTWDEESYFQALEPLQPFEVDAIRHLYQYGLKNGYQIRWGTGASRGSLGLRHPAICPRTILTVFTDGHLTFNYVWLDGSDQAEAFRDELRSRAAQELDLATPDGRRGKEFTLSSWVPHLSALTALLDELVTKWGTELA